MADDFTGFLSIDVEAEVEVRDAAKREIDVRLLPWDTTIDTVQGPEEFARGSFADVAPDGLLLMGLEHEAHLAVGQDGRPTLARRPVGRSRAVWEGDDGPHATFRVAHTAAGDEVLALAVDRVVRGVSVEFREVPGGTVVQNRSGRRVRVHQRSAPTGASLTYRPAYGEQAAVLAVRSQHEQEITMSESEPVAAPVPEVDLTPVLARMDNLTERFGALEERARAAFTIPAAEPELPTANRGQWMAGVLRMLSGERISDLEMRVLADLVTSDNVGVVPDAYSSELIGVIDPTRRFLNSTRRLDLPPAGMSLVVPKIVTRPTAGVQAVYGDESYPEKTELTSTATSITNASYDAITIAGAGDISLQLLKRSSPSYLSLYLELLAEAYANNAETQAVGTLSALVGDPGGVNDGGVCDPEDLVLGDAWAAGAAVRKPIDTMWLSSAAVGAFIDAKASGTNAPLYSTIQAGFTAGAGAAGTISGLRPVWVPALDSSGVDVLVGPSGGFAWAEDGTYTLQVDVPAKAGRDVALVGILWFAPMYPTAFTAYTIAS